MANPASVDRRGFVRRALGAVGALFGALFGVPGLAVVVDPALSGASAGWADAGSAAEVGEGRPKRFSYEVESGWEKSRQVGFLVRRGGEIVAYHARCTHLGCIVRASESGFRCPCHGGAFDLDGEPEKGPVTEPLRRFETRVDEAGRIQVRI